MQFLPGLDTKSILGSNILNYKEVFENIKTRLLEETMPDEPLKILVEPMFGKKEVVYRIVNTRLTV